MEKSIIFNAAEAVRLAGSGAEIAPATLKTLRCPYPGAFGVICLEDRNLTAIDHAELSVCLPQLLRARSGAKLNPDATTSILVGVSKYSAWSTFPSCEDDSYALAIAILFYVDDYGHGGMTNGYMDLFARPYICDMLNTWLKPAVRWTELPGVITIAQNMFGYAWCDLVLHSNVRDVIGGYRGMGSNYALNHLVARDRPPFLPGLCQDHDDFVGESLPGDIGCAT